MQIYKALPDLSKSRLMRVWHQALARSWSPTEVDWDAPGTPTRDAQLDALGRILSPILTGEQAGLYSIAQIIRKLGATSEVESQLFLSTQMVDESRHLELFTRYYHRLEREPLPIRRMPSGYLFQAKIMADEPVDWLPGSLVSEVVAKRSLEELREKDVDPVFTDFSGRILDDEARHLAFNHLWVEDRVAGKGADGNRLPAEEEARRIRGRVEEVLEMVPPILDALQPDIVTLGISRPDLEESIFEESRRRIEKSIESGFKHLEGRGVRA
ncbi:MAG: ferritin-like domain-containing protein [Planctomycetes bacterium]|nr:ferritin-like domain-containing protein [Planctomycetota bacterium]